jgi:hypothetical protein
VSTCGLAGKEEPPEKIDSLADDVKPVGAGAAAKKRWARGARRQLVAQNKALLELKAKHGRQPKMLDSSSLPAVRRGKRQSCECWSFWKKVLPTKLISVVQIRFLGGFQEGRFQC